MVEGKIKRNEQLNNREIIVMPTMIPITQQHYFDDHYNSDMGHNYSFANIELHISLKACDFMPNLNESPYLGFYHIHSRACLHILLGDPDFISVINGNCIAYVFHARFLYNQFVC